VLVVYTKSDLVSTEVRERLEREGNLVVSATTGAGLEQLLDRLRPLLPEGPFEYDPDDIGTQPLRFFVAEYLREAAFRYLEDELPYAVAAEVEEFRESQDPVYIRATLVVERETQKRIVIGAGGQQIKAIGQHARQRLEQLIGRRVRLETWVKVAPKWRQNAVQLARFGFPDLPTEHP
jgi:GTP-binding protein Era